MGRRELLFGAEAIFGEMVLEEVVLAIGWSLEYEPAPLRASHHPEPRTQAGPVREAFTFVTARATPMLPLERKSSQFDESTRIAPPLALSTQVKQRGSIALGRAVTHSSGKFGTWRSATPQTTITRAGRWTSMMYR